MVALTPAAARAQLPPGTRLEVPEPPTGAVIVPGPGARPPGGGEPADPPVPVVALRVRVAAAATAAQDLEYRLVAENLARAPAHHVLVRFPLPANAEFVRANPEPTEQKPELVWRLGTLKGGERKEIVLAVKPTGDGDVQACARVQFEHGECVRTRLVKPGEPGQPAPPKQAEPPPKQSLPGPPPAPPSGLRVRKSGPARAVVNDLVTFQIDVTNTGPADAADVVVADKLPDGLDFLDAKPAIDVSQTPRWNIGALAPGKTQRVEYRAVAKREGTFTNRAEVTASGGGRETAEATLTVGEPKLSVSLTGPHVALVGRPANYVVTVSNPGSAALKNVRVSQHLIREMRLDGSVPQGRVVPDDVRKQEKLLWPLGDLEPGARKTVQLKYTASQPGTFDLWVNAEADRVDSSQDAYASTRFLEAPRPAVLIDKRGEDLDEGVERTLTVWVANPGAADATDLDLTLTLPDGFEAKDLVGATADEANKRALKFRRLPLLAKGTEYALGRVTVTASKAGEAVLPFELRAGGKVVDTDNEKITVLAPRKPR
jgi:uncharacterized repeat protein (TIGR01451 family)